MISDTTRRHKTWFQEVDVLKNLKILTKSWRILYISGRIQNMGRVQLESTSKIITIGIENSSFGYDLIIWNFVKRGLYHRCVRTSWFLKLVPWRRVLRTTLFCLLLLACFVFCCLFCLLILVCFVLSLTFVCFVWCCLFCLGIHRSTMQSCSASYNS